MLYPDVCSNVFIAGAKKSLSSFLQVWSLVVLAHRYKSIARQSMLVTYDQGKCLQCIGRWNADGLERLEADGGTLLSKPHSIACRATIASLACVENLIFLGQRREDKDRPEDLKVLSACTFPWQFKTLRTVNTFPYFSRSMGRFKQCWGSMRISFIQVTRPGSNFKSTPFVTA